MSNRFNDARRGAKVDRTTERREDGSQVYVRGNTAHERAAVANRATSAIPRDGLEHYGPMALETRIQSRAANAAVGRRQLDAPDRSVTPPRNPRR